MKVLNDWKVLVVLCLTLGLAPFTPEPHIWGKLKWILGGGNGMEVVDWLDVVIHGVPFLLLIRLGVLNVKRKFKSE